MKRILQTYLEKQYNDGNLLFLGDVKEIIDILDDIKTEYLYKSDFHGLYHSQKVCFFAYLIGKHENLSNDDMRILLDAARYHDIGRKSDYEEDLHGLISAREIDKVIKYENPLDMYYLKAIVESHAHDDSSDLKVFGNWLEEEKNDNLLLKRNLDDMNVERFLKLSDILKDADALDRLRFKNCPAVLDEKYLRKEYSKKLIKLSEVINNFYHKVYVEEEYNKMKDKYAGNDFDKVICYHSVGFDFFKALSILKNGILSHYNATRNNINISRNFNGNNGEFWISVVNADSNAENKEAYDKYVKNGISFLCYANELVDGVSRPKDNGSCEPRISDEYHDEKFVFDKIPVEHIQHLMIPRHLYNEDIRKLPYLYCNSQYELIKMSINNYLNEIEEYCNIKINRNEFDSLLNELKDIQLKFNNMPRGEAIRVTNEYFSKINEIKQGLNEKIQNWMQIGFAELLNKKFTDVITLKEVITYILRKANIDYTFIDDNENIKNDFLTENDLPFYKDDDSYLFRFSSFDLNKNTNHQNKAL